MKIREKHREKDQMKSLSEYKFMLIPCTFNAKPSVRITRWLSTLSFEGYPKFAPVSRLTVLTGLWDLVSQEGLTGICIGMPWGRCTAV